MPTQIGRMYETLSQSTFGGIGLVTRVGNDPASKAAWSTFEAGRYNLSSVSLYSAGGGILQSDAPDLWVLQDALPIRYVCRGTGAYCTAYAAA